MSESITARRYAEALFQLGNEKNTLDKYVEELKLVHEVFKDNEQLYIFLKHPRVNHEKKKQLLTEVFQDLQADVINTVQLLVERGHAEITPSVIDHFLKMVNDAKGIADAKIYSVRELSDAEKQALKDSIKKRFNKADVQMESIIDTSLLGGLKIQVGNTILDGSVSGKLKRIKRNIVTANK